AGITNPATQPALLKLVLPKKEFYVGESFPAQLQLYLSGRVQNIGNFQITSFPNDGFNLGKIQFQENQRRQIQLGNAVYTMIPMSAVLTALKPGPSTLGPVTANVVLELLSANRRRDAFDVFFDRSEHQQAALSTESEEIRILPLPR